MNVGGPLVPPGIGLAARTESKSHGPEEFRLCDSTFEASNDRGGKRVAERSSVSEEIGTIHRDG